MKNGNNKMKPENIFKPPQRCLHALRQMKVKLQKKEEQYEKKRKHKRQKINRKRIQQTEHSQANSTTAQATEMMKVDEYDIQNKS